MSDAAGNAADVLAALHVTDRTPVQADAHIDAIDSSQGEAPQAGSNEHANDNASHRADNAGDGIGNSNASDTGLEHANDNAFDGAGNANDKSDNGNADHDVDLPDAAEEHEGAGSPHAPENVPDHVELPFD